MNIRPAGLVVEGDTFLTMRYEYGETQVYVLPGGNPDPGEPLVEALRREFMEELGIEVSVGDLILAGEVLNFRKGQDTFHCVFRVSMAKNQVPRLNAAHTSAREVVWLPFEALGTITLYPNFAAQLSVERAGDAFHYAGVLRQPYHE